MAYLYNWLRKRFGGRGLAVVPSGEASHSFEFVAAPPDLAPYLNSLYIWRTSDGQLDDVLPAYSGQMVVFGRGVGRMQFDDVVSDTSDAFFVAPLCQARNFSVSGPGVVFGVSLNFRGWAALSGLSVRDYHDAFLQPETVLQDPLAELILGGEIHDGDLVPVTVGSDGLLIGERVGASNRPRPDDAVVH